MPAGNEEVREERKRGRKKRKETASQQCNFGKRNLRAKIEQNNIKGTESKARQALIILQMLRTIIHTLVSFSFSIFAKRKPCLILIFTSASFFFLHSLQIYKAIDFAFGFLRFSLPFFHFCDFTLTPLRKLSNR